MSLVTTVVNITGVDDKDARLVPEAPIERTFVETRSSRELFEEYARSYPEVLQQWGITDYVRNPNGSGDFAGVWVHPYPDDIWDYWVNYRFREAGVREYIGPDNVDYIPNPSRPFFSKNMPYEGDPVYSRELIYLWDFIHNPEAVMARFASASARFNRRLEFPVYTDNAGSVSSDEDIMPPYLPDATFPRSFAKQYPWAAWELEFNLGEAQVQGDVEVALHATRAQLQRYVRAHGRDLVTSERDTDAYRFEPHDATSSLGKVMRPLYPIREASLYRSYFGVPYAPLVVRNLSPFNTNGWIFFYRQAVRYSSDMYFPKSKLWDAFKEANRLLHGNKNMSVDYAVSIALPRQHRVLWLGFDPLALPQDVTLEIPAKGVDTKEASEIQLLRELVDRARRRQDIYELATTPDGPLMERKPYKVVTIQVYELEPQVRQLVSFEQQAAWTLTVPPILSTSRPSRLEYFSTDATIIWHTGASNKRISIMFDGEDVASAHQIRVTASKRGETFVEAKITRVLRSDERPYRVRYRFDLSWLDIAIKAFDIDHARANAPFDVGAELSRLGATEADCRWLQITNPIMYAYVGEPRRVEAYFVDKWKRFKDLEAWNVNARNGFVLPIDFTRPVVLVREKGRVYVLVLKLREVLIRVPHFGEEAHIVVAYDAQSDYVTWQRPSGVNVAEMNIVVVSPRQLGKYIAEIRRKGKTGEPDYVVPFVVELVWDTPIPYGYIQRSTRGDWSQDNPAVAHRIMVRPTTDVQLLYNLRVDYKGAFFEAMIEAWAQNYMIDLRNYAQCFPYVIDYCRHMEALAGALNATVVSTLSDEFRLMLPLYMAEPLLLLDVRDAKPNVEYAYVVFDPLASYWINVVAFEHAPVPDGWLPPVHRALTTLYEKVQRVFPRVSIELQERGRITRRAVSDDVQAVYDRREDIRRELTALRQEWLMAPSRIANTIRSFEVDFEETAAKFRRRWFGEIAERVVIDNSVVVDRELQLVRAYTRFVGQVLVACLNVDVSKPTQDSVAATRIVAFLHTSHADSLAYKDAFVSVWPQIAQQFSYLRYGVYAAAAVGDDVNNLLVAAQADGYPLNGDYVLYKFLWFIINYNFIAIARDAKEKILVFVNYKLDVLMKQKMLLLNDNY